MKLWLRIALSIALVVVLFTYVVDGAKFVSILHRLETKPIWCSRSSWSRSIAC